MRKSKIISEKFWEIFPPGLKFLQCWKQKIISIDPKKSGQDQFSTHFLPCILFFILNPSWNWKIAMIFVTWPVFCHPQKMAVKKRRRKRRCNLRFTKNRRMNINDGLEECTIFPRRCKERATSLSSVCNIAHFRYRSTCHTPLLLFHRGSSLYLLHCTHFFPLQLSTTTAATITPLRFFQSNFSDSQLELLAYLP